ncbi:hypothetical protein EYF80_048931 [Liparis tanakae]|uniref:Uncharacterized protein n=1 Tax=Liparis tanakae TaxID=230148 RepID=A0A4Z2FI21_9TELE|nr:hypothetical protein EYF80_048931 [Liparis tanakae]
MYPRKAAVHCRVVTLSVPDSQNGTSMFSSLHRALRRPNSVQNITRDLSVRSWRRLPRHHQIVLIGGDRQVDGLSGRDGGSGGRPGSGHIRRGRLRLHVYLDEVLKVRVFNLGHLHQTGLHQTGLVPQVLPMINCKTCILAQNPSAGVTGDPSRVEQAEGGDDILASGDELEIKETLASYSSHVDTKAGYLS